MGTYIVTGAAGGVGRASVEALVARGDRVVAEDLDPAVEALAGDSVAVVVGDVADSATVAAVVETALVRFGGIDVLYNNAGISPADDDSILVTEEDAWDRVQDVNTKCVYFCCKHGIPHLLEAGGGSVAAGAVPGAECAST